MLQTSDKDAVERLLKNRLFRKPFLALIFKRVLSFSLSASLAFSPTLAFASRAPGKKNLKSQAKLSHLQAKAQALSKSKMMTGGEALREFFPVAHTRAGDLNVVQEPGRNGRLRSQIVRGKNFEEILVDEHGNGTASFWQVTRGNRKFTASNPYRGRFTKLEVEERRSKAVIKSKFYWNPRQRRYGLANIDVVPYKLQSYKADAVANTCQLRAAGPTLVENIDSLETFLKQVSDATAKPADAALACKLKRFQDMFVDPSCQNQRFAGSIDAMLEGLAKTLASMPDGNRDSQLKCVEDHGFAPNSEKIKAYFLRNKVAIEAALKAQGYGPDKFYDNNCTRLYGITVAGAQVNLSSLVTYPKMITCDASTSEAGRWNPDSMQIIVGRNQDEIMAATRLPSASKADAYAALFTHELLHESGFPEQEGEATVQSLESCCAYPQREGQMVRSACENVDKTALQTKAAQAVESVLSGNPAFAGTQNLIYSVFGRDKGGDFMDDWEQGFATDQPTANAVGTLQTCWKQANGNAAAQEKCASAASSQFTKYTKNFVKAECSSYATVSHASTGTQYCGTISTQLVSLVQLNAPASNENPSVSLTVAGKSGSAKMAQNLVTKINENFPQEGTAAPAPVTVTAPGPIPAPNISEEAPVSISIVNPKLTTAPLPVDLSSFAGSLAVTDDPQRIQNTNTDPRYSTTLSPALKPAAVANLPGLYNPNAQGASAAGSAPPTDHSSSSNQPGISTQSRNSNIAVATRAGANVSDTGSTTSAANSDGSSSPTTSTASNQGNDGTPAILNLPSTSPLSMPTISASSGLLGNASANRPDGIQSTTTYADTRIGNALEHGAQAAASLVRDSILATPANASVAQLIRAPASEGESVSPSGGGGFGGRNYASSSRSSGSASFASSSSSSSPSSAPPKSRLPADESEKKVSAKARNESHGGQGSDGSVSADVSANPPAKAEFVEDPDKISEVSKSEIGQRFPNGTTLDRELLMATGGAYDSFNAKLSDAKNRSNWSALLAARSRQIVLATGVRLGSPHPVNCWAENPNAKRFDRVKCGSR